MEPNIYSVNKLHHFSSSYMRFRSLYSKPTVQFSQSSTFNGFSPQRFRPLRVGFQSNSPTVSCSFVAQSEVETSSLAAESTVFVNTVLQAGMPWKVERGDEVNDKPSIRVLFCGTDHSASQDCTREYLKKYPFIQVDVLHHKEVPDRIGDYHLCIVKAIDLDSDVISRTYRMKIIMQFGVGIEGVDIDAATKNGIKVVRIPGGATGNAASCAEMATYIMLGLLKKQVGIVKKSFISSMKQGALLVHIARGGLLDYEAVVQHVESGHLGGLGIDVAWTEPFDPDDPILKFKSVIITPHVAGVTEPSYRSMAKVVGVVALQVNPRNPLEGIEFVN